VAVAMEVALMAEVGMAEADLEVVARAAAVRAMGAVVREVAKPVAEEKVVGWVAAAKAAAAKADDLAARAAGERREMRTQQTGCPPLPHSCQCHCMRQRSTHQCSHSAS